MGGMEVARQVARTWDGSGVGRNVEQSLKKKKNSFDSKELCTV